MRRLETVLLHAYDARNLGDLLLARESLAFLERAGVDPSKAGVVAYNATSFEPALLSTHAGVLSASSVGGLAWGSTDTPSVRGAIADAKLLVGVGGGYLRAPGGVDSLKAALVQLPQLTMATQAEAPTVYLPQSVGPLRGPLGAALRRQLQAVDILAVRDDQSLREVRHARTTRVPDLAVLAVARQWDRIEVRRSGRVALGVARRLGNPGSYAARLQGLADEMDVWWTTQSRTRMQNDAVFYRSIGLRSVGDLPMVIRRPEVGVVISVRLHGALEAILAGVPAIHLGYERKAEGAYADLGIQRWLHPARSFDPKAVAHEAQALLGDSDEFWGCIASAIPRIQEQEESLRLTVNKLATS